MSTRRVCSLILSDAEVAALSLATAHRTLSQRTLHTADVSSARAAHPLEDQAVCSVCAVIRADLWWGRRRRRRRHCSCLGISTGQRITACTRQRNCGWSPGGRARASASASASASTPPLLIGLGQGQLLLLLGHQLLAVTDAFRDVRARRRIGRRRIATKVDGRRWCW
jgi:hypothetical protein